MRDGTLHYYSYYQKCDDTTFYKRLFLVDGLVYFILIFFPLVFSQATDKCPDLFLESSSCGKSSSRTVRAVNGQDSVVFQLGLQSVEQCRSIAFCNGPLEAETEYYVKLRAFTQSGFTDTDYSSKIRTGKMQRGQFELCLTGD